MIRRIAICGMLGLLTLGAAAAWSQNVPDAPAPHPADPHAAQKPNSNPASSPSTPAPSSSDDNSFPEDQSKKAAAATDAPAADNRGTQSSGTKDSETKSSTDDNAFPEAKSEAAAKAAGATGAPDADSPDVSSSRKTAGTGESESDGDVKGDDQGLNANLPKQGDVALAPDPRRAAKDVQVGKFYLDTKNYKGAYARFKEASTLSPEDPEIVFLVAEAARRLDHLDEAVVNYKLCLQLDPDGPRSKAAKRAVAEFDKLAAR